MMNLESRVTNIVAVGFIGRERNGMTSTLMVCGVHEEIVVPLPTQLAHTKHPEGISQRLSIFRSSQDSLSLSLSLSLRVKMTKGVRQKNNTDHRDSRT